MVLAASAMIAPVAAALPAAADPGCETRTASVSSTSHLEGGQLADGRLTFEVTTSGCAAASVDYRTVAAPVGQNVATEGADYTAAVGSLSWSRGDLGPRVITVWLKGDLAVEADETLTVELYNPSAGLTLLPGRANGTIINDDTILDIDGEPFCWLIAADCPVTLNSLVRLPVDVTVSYSTSDGTATSNQDYIGVPKATMIIPAGATQVDTRVRLRGDRVLGAKYFYVTISEPSLGTIGVSRQRVTIPAS